MSWRIVRHQRGAGQFGSRANSGQGTPSSRCYAITAPAIRLGCSTENSCDRRACRFHRGWSENRPSRCPSRKHDIRSLASNLTIRKLQPMTLPPPHPVSRWLVTTEWLAANLGADGLVVLDGSYYLPTMNRDAAAEYRAGHIQGPFGSTSMPSRTIRLTCRICCRRLNILPMRSQARHWERRHHHRLRRTRHVSSPRVWFTFRLFGAENVFILEGGLPKWREEGRPIEVGQVSRPPKTFTARKRGEVVASVDRIREALATRSAQVVDRAPPTASAAKRRSRGRGLRSGQCPVLSTCRRARS